MASSPLPDNDTLTTTNQLSQDILTSITNDPVSSFVIGWWDGSSLSYNQLRGAGPCAVIDSIGVWHSVPCDGPEYGYICEQASKGKGIK